jgi:predicted O-linked N-acetylglucosamine transferase (SPINDLY family)
LGSSNDEETKLAKTKASTFTQDQASLEKWVSAILDKNIEVIIYPEIGMDQITVQLANLRLAPLQLVSWGHPETTGIPTIDYYLSAKLFEDSHAQDNYTEKLFELPNLGCTYSNLAVIPSTPDVEIWGINTHFPILLCPGTLQKYAPEYDCLFIEIVKRLGKCNIVLFTSTKERALVFKERLTKLFIEAELNLNDYVVFIPWLKSSDFYGLMQQSDVLLDPIGFSGFNTAMQAIDCDLPIVTREGRFMRGRLASGILKRMSLSELIVNTEEDYIALVVRLVEDKKYRQDMGKKIYENKAVLYNDLEPVQALETFLLHKCRFNLYR